MLKASVTGNAQYDQIIVNAENRPANPDASAIVINSDGTWTQGNYSGTYTQNGNTVVIRSGSSEVSYTLTDNNTLSLSTDRTSYIQARVSNGVTYQGVPTETTVISATQIQTIKKK